MSNMCDVIQVSPTYRHYDKVTHSHGVIDPTISGLKSEVTKLVFVGRDDIARRIEDAFLDARQQPTLLHSASSQYIRMRSNNTYSLF